MSVWTVWPNPAVTVVSALMVTVHVGATGQAPPQPLKVEPAAGVAVNSTTVPSRYEAEQVTPQEIPAGALATLPEPVPLRWTSSRCVVAGGGSPPGTVGTLATATGTVTLAEADDGDALPAPSTAVSV